MAPDVSMDNGVSLSPAPHTIEKPAAAPNVLEVVFGSLLIKPWYPSFYPEELVGRKVERLYVCQWCFKYTKELTGFIKHLVSTTHPRVSNVKLTICTAIMCTASLGTTWHSYIHLKRIFTVRNRW